MLFNSRRQSRDSKVIEDISKITNGQLSISSYSEPLFKDSGIRLTISDNILNCANYNEYCFIENLSLSHHTDSINSITVYWWNKKYPCDFSLDIDFEAQGFKSVSIYEFPGTSHETITREVFKK